MQRSKGAIACLCELQVDRLLAARATCAQGHRGGLHLQAMRPPNEGAIVAQITHQLAEMRDRSGRIRAYTSEDRAIVMEHKPLRSSWTQAVEGHSGRRAPSTCIRAVKPTLASRHPRTRLSRHGLNPRRCLRQLPSHVSAHKTTSHSNNTRRNHEDSTERRHTTPPPAGATPLHRVRGINGRLRRTGPPQYPPLPCRCV